MIRILALLPFLLFVPGLLAQVPLQQDLVAHWTFDRKDIKGDKALNTGHAGAALDALRKNGVAVSAGKLGHAANFNNTGFYKVEGNAQALALGRGVLSVGFWYTRAANPKNSRQKTRILLSTGAGSDSQAGWMIQAGNTDITLLAGDGSIRKTKTFPGTHKITRKGQQWSHLVAVFDWVAKRATLYINGEEQGHTNLTGLKPVPNASSLVIGGRSGKVYRGMIDDVMIWKRGLSAQEVGILYKRDQALVAVAAPKPAPPKPPAVVVPPLADGVPAIRVCKGPGQGIDLQGRFIYALSFDAKETVQVGKVAFLPHAQATQPKFSRLLGSSTPQPVHFGEAPDAVALASVFSSQSHGPKGMDISLPVKAGTRVKLQLLFAECQLGQSAAGKRSFDIEVEGKKLFRNFEIAREMKLGQPIPNEPRRHGVVVSHTFSASDSTINIRLGSRVENPTLSGLTLERAGRFRLVGEEGGLTSLTFLPGKNRSLRIAGSAFDLEFGADKQGAPTLKLISRLGDKKSYGPFPLEDGQPVRLGGVNLLLRAD